MSVSLHEFGSTVGCDYTTASRLLSGERAPSTRLLHRICEAYGLDAGEALRILAADQARAIGSTPRFAAFLREQVFESNVADVTSEPLLSPSQDVV